MLRYVPTAAPHDDRQAVSMAEKLDLHRRPAEMGFWLSPRRSVAARRRGLGVWSKAETERFWSV